MVLVLVRALNNFLFSGPWNCFFFFSHPGTIFSNAYFILRESIQECKWGEGLRERERERGERESQAVSALSVQSPTWGSIPPTMRSWPEPKSGVECLTNWATQVPLGLFFKAALYIHVEWHSKTQQKFLWGFWNSFCWKTSLLSILSSQILFQFSWTLIDVSYNSCQMWALSGFLSVCHSTKLSSSQ